MKPHLPKLLLTAVVMACSVAQAEVAQWERPTFGGKEHTWTGSAGTMNYDDAANWAGSVNPSNGTNANGGKGKSPVYIFDGVTGTIAGGSGVDTSDYGGIKVTGNSNVTCSIGRWAGSIYVEEGSILSTSYTKQLKDDYSGSTANVYVGGTLTITNEGALNINDGDKDQNWQIDSNGLINLSGATSVAKKDGGSWNIQYLKAAEPVAVNRAYEEIEVTKQLITSSFNLTNAVDSVTVIDKSTGNALANDSYRITYGENGGLTLAFDERKYAAASLETSGNITWKHGASGWTIAGGDSTDTSFLNGDTVAFVGDGSAALEGDITVAGFSVSDGVNYSVNMAADSSLKVTNTLTKFENLKITGGSTTSLHLNMATDAEGEGDSRIMLADGSSVGTIYTTGVVAFNTQNGSLDSNFGGADLHIADGGVLLLRNGLSGEIDANIKDIYFDGSAELRVYGSVSNAKISDNIYATGTILKSDTGKVELAGTVTADALMAKGGELRISGSVTTKQLRLSENGAATLTLKDGGSLTVTGNVNDHSTGRSVLLAHWGQTSVLAQEGGQFNAENAVVFLSWTGSGTYKATGGVANVLGISFREQEWDNSYNPKGLLELGSGSSGSARINIGSEGISHVSHSAQVRLGNGILGATADWVFGYKEGATSADVQLIGTNTGTVFNTEDANTPGTGRTITVNTTLTGAGKLVKEGVGKLVLNGANTYSGVTHIKAGMVELGNDAALGSGMVKLEGGSIEITANRTIKNDIDMADSGTYAGDINIATGKELELHHEKKIWISNKASINLADDAKFTYGTLSIVGTGDDSYITRGENGDNKFSADSANHIVNNAEVTVTSDSATEVKLQLKDSSVTNAGAGALTVADMTVTDASKKQSVLTGDMTVTKLTLAAGLSDTVAAVTTTGALTLGNITLNLTDYVAGSYTLVSATNGGSISWNEKWTNTGTLAEGLIANVGFVGEGKNTLQLTVSEIVNTSADDPTKVLSYTRDGNALTLMVEDPISANATVYVGLLEPSMADEILTGLNGETMVTIALKGSNGTVINADTIDKVVFVNEKGQGYWGEMVDFGGEVGTKLAYNVNRIPEPTTTTLSLLALSVLAMRRRRK